jgi:hypothetical protein
MERGINIVLFIAWNISFQSGFFKQEIMEGDLNHRNRTSMTSAGQGSRAIAFVLLTQIVRRIENKENSAARFLFQTAQKFSLSTAY